MLGQDLFDDDNNASPIPETPLSSSTETDHSSPAAVDGSASQIPETPSSSSTETDHSSPVGIDGSASQIPAILSASPPETVEAVLAEGSALALDKLVYDILTAPAQREFLTEDETNALIARAATGEDEAFKELGRCYRMRIELNADRNLEAINMLWLLGYLRSHHHNPATRTIWDRFWLEQYANITINDLLLSPKIGFHKGISTLSLLALEAYKGDAGPWRNVWRTHQEVITADILTFTQPDGPLKGMSIFFCLAVHAASKSSEPFKVVWNKRKHDIPGVCLLTPQTGQKKTTPIMDYLDTLKFREPALWQEISHKNLQAISQQAKEKAKEKAKKKETMERRRANEKELKALQERLKQVQQELRSENGSSAELLARKDPKNRAANPLIYSTSSPSVPAEKDVIDIEDNDSVNEGGVRSRNRSQRSAPN